MSKLSSLITFTVGAAIGSAVTWLILRDKYEKIVQEEIHSIKLFYSQKHKFTEDKTGESINLDEVSVKEPEEEPEYIDEEKKRYSELISVKGYSKEKPKFTDKDKPYVITPEVFAENEDYSIVTLTCYDDDVLVDIDGNIIDVETVGGHDTLMTFGDYEDDATFVRDDRLKIDYEILLDPRRYEEVYNTVNE